ncbi:MAG: NADH-quinone oxidoreductase subunit NuoN [Alphaproteobacteria bacterium]|uniref:NADH-quinone oxidoreductase subunit NuoN n=1 Tax=Maricaulis alexandrii TaxID=2570354 RepID=UPI001108C260|nr:NADH-quinone oxidoreductase subunit NuoN [Maricaulis alexandrii]MCR9268131.1 NADH-quinone oxidoreductase subunit NuoN [Alphaproteobacteria bacterium]
MTADMLSQDLSLLIPELLLAGGAMALLMLGVFMKGEGANKLVQWLAVVLLAGAGLASLFLVTGEGQAFDGGFIFDGLARFSKVAIGVVAAIALLLAMPYLKAEKLGKIEYSVLMTLAVTGMFMMVSANDLISMYMGIELQSLSLYVLAAFNRDSLRASEAGLKYFVLGALSSGLLLYGSSLVYGFAGATGFNEIAIAVQSGPSVGLTFGLVFVICGLAFKVSAAPFHMWTPDVYEGAPTPVTAFFATAPKMAAIVLLARVLIEPFGGMVEQWRDVIWIVAVLSMGIGAFGALTQTNIKRLMAYSSISNMGYALVAIASASQTGLWALLVYMILYMIGVIGSFGAILSMRTREGMVEQISDLAGIAQRNPGLGWSITALMFSIGGLPFMVGFFGKFFVVFAAVQEGMLILAVLAVLFSVVGAAYYLRVVKTVWFDEGEVEFVPAAVSVYWVTRLAGLATVLLLPVIGWLVFRAYSVGLATL